MSNKKLTAAERFAKLGENLKKDGRLQIDKTKLELSEQIFQMMEKKGISEAELSRRLNVSRAYVNKMLQGDTNFTTETLVKIGIALDCEYKSEFVDNDMEIDIIDAEIIYINEPISKPEYSKKKSGYKPNGFYDFEDYKYEQFNNPSVNELQY